MNLRRIGVLFTKEMRQGATNFFFTYAIMMPVVLSLIVSAVFGDLFSEKPRLGLYDEGDSAIVAILTGQEHLETTIYTSEAALRDAVERGVVTSGLIIPQELDDALRAGGEPQLTVLRWSESLASNDAIIGSATYQALAQIAGVESPIRIEPVQLGEAQDVTWTERLLPLIVLMTIVLGGVLVPAASLVDEKQKRTLGALVVTPVTLLDVYASKALLGTAISIIMALIVLALNSAFGGQPVLLVSVLLMSAVASSIFGVLLGSFVKDVNVLLAVIKAGGIILFAPAILELIPSAPEWIARLFPTYYLLNPVLEVSVNGAGLSDILSEMAVLLAIIGVMVFALVSVMERQQKRLALSS